MENPEIGINNFGLVAYNNGVEKITVMQNLNGRPDRYIPYLYKKIREKYDFQSSECKIEREKGASSLVFEGEEGLCPHFRKFAAEHISDILSIGYKFDFFSKNLPLPLLDGEEKFLLYAALVAADYPEDKRYVARRVSVISNCSLDGVYNFRLAELKARWKEVIEYIPADFGSYSLEGFLDYVIAEGEGKAYLKKGKVYDENYRLQEKSELLGRKSAIADLLLGGVGSVYCFGETDSDTKSFLKKYYKEKAVFC